MRKSLIKFIFVSYLVRVKCVKHHAREHRKKCKTVSVKTIEKQHTYMVGIVGTMLVRVLAVLPRR